jgi:transposase
VALEPIGPYAWPVTAALVAAGFEVGLADPRQVRAFRTAEGRIAKTDRLDAGLVARFARTMPERLRPAPEPQTLALKALSTRRRQLTELVAMEKTRLGQAFDETIAASHRAVIAALEAACKAVEARLDAAIAADPALVRRRRILVSIPGIGARIAGVVIADMPELGALGRKAAASLAGMAPHPDQSGRPSGTQRPLRRTAVPHHRLLHGGHGRRPLRSPLQGALSRPPRCRQASQGRHRRHRPSHRHHRQRTHPRGHHLRAEQVRRLTPNTVAG